MKVRPLKYNRTESIRFNNVLKPRSEFSACKLALHGYIRLLRSAPLDGGLCSGSTSQFFETGRCVIGSKTASANSYFDTLKNKVQFENIGLHKPLEFLDDVRPVLDCNFALLMYDFHTCGYY